MVRQTSVIIIEDLHWLDEAARTSGNLDRGSGRHPGFDGADLPARVVLRRGQPSYLQLALPELGFGDVSKVIRDLIGDGAELDPVVAHVAERSDGNPFFAEELVLSLARSGVLVGERGRYRLAPSGWQNPSLPTTVEAVIGARIDLLPTPKRSCCRPLRSSGKSFHPRWFASSAVCRMRPSGRC